MSRRIPSDRPPNPNFETARAIDGTLAERLGAYDASLKVASPAAWTAYQGLVERLLAAGAGRSAPTVGDPLPPFVLPNENGRLVSSVELAAAGPLIVSFNRGNWCPYCWLELCALEDARPAIEAAGAAVLSITPETATFSRRLKTRLGLAFPVLTDLDNGYALTLGLACAIDDAVRAVYDRAAIDLAAYQNGEGGILPIPATLIVDRKGIIRHAYVNADFRERIEPDKIPGILAAL